MRHLSEMKGDMQITDVTGAGWSLTFQGQFVMAGKGHRSWRSVFVSTESLQTEEHFRLSSEIPVLQSQPQPLPSGDFWGLKRQETTAV